MPDHVILVEDELFVALDVQMTIEEMGLSVLGPHTSLAEAEQALGGTLPEKVVCAVLDVQLRDGEVFPLADRLAAAAVPIIFHSGHADPHRLEGRYPGVTVCEKPCAPGTLRKALQKMLTRHQG